jgi:two-component system NarL family sensor kinase
MSHKGIYLRSSIGKLFSNWLASIDPRWSIAGSFIVIIVLEFSTPPDYVFGYLYIGAILLARWLVGRQATFGVAIASVVLTLSNLWITRWPDAIATSTIANRVITACALAVTSILSDSLWNAYRRNRDYEETFAQKDAQLRAQTQLSQVREDFAATLTHDLRTPLLGAIAALESLMSGKFGEINPMQEQVLVVMARSHRNTLQMVQTLLDIYHNDINGLELRLSRVNLVELAKEVIATLTHLAESRQVTIIFKADPEHSGIWIIGDALQLRRVFTNLLINAINHTLRSDDVCIEMELSKSFGNKPPQCTVRIIDSGPGITPEELPYLFERFFQGESDRQALGVGLGLYLSRQIVEAHGGTIWVENRLPRGAIFSFRIPA